MPRTRLWYAVALCLPALLLSTTLFAASPGLTVKESDSEMLFEEHGAAVSLAVVNTTGRELAARVEVELLDPSGRVVVRAADDALVRRGDGRVRIPLAFLYSRLDYSQQRSFPWYRLRYRLTPQASGAVQGAAPDPAAGIVSLSEITPDLFELRVLSPERARAGSPLRAHVRTLHPVTRQPVKGVAVEGQLDWETEDDEDDEEEEKEEKKKRAPYKAKAVTDDDGQATLDFRAPLEMEGSDFDLEIKASRNGFQETASDEVDIDRLARVLITTDKPLYQPGQTLHVRALVFDASRRAVREQEVSFEIEDPEGTTAFSAEVTTSRFGVASADWEIPAGTRLGDYAVKVGLDEDKFGEESKAERSVKISRYDLPNFSVGAAPDRPFYLAGQNAEVEVRADYLFGQPVKRGRVRVVRESERRWSFSEQKYVAEEGDKIEGELDAEGRFVARLDLSKEHAALAGAGWERFRDLDFAAYVTDASTNRTEQRRFRLRATKDEIHLYVTPGRNAPRTGLPLALYVSTFYPDGTPAECDVTVGEVAASEAQAANAAAGRKTDAGDRTLLTVRTNRYGVARVVGPAPGLREGQSNYLSLRLLARDREGRTGRHAEDFWLNDDDDERAAIRVNTDKTLYRAGEPVRVEVTSDAPELSVFVDASVESRVVASSAVRLRGGRATLVLPYTPEFQDEVQIAAVATHVGARYDDNYVAGTRSIIYPRNRELKLDVETSRAVYRPGEEASATLGLRDARGRRAEGALGVVVFDKAVEERARTDSEFGAEFGFGGAFYDFWYGPTNIGGVTRRDLERLDTSRPFPAGLDVVAEMLLNGYDNYSPNVFGGTDFEDDQSRLFGTLTSAHLSSLKSALANRYERDAAYPSDEDSLRRILSREGIDFDATRDPWGTPFRAAFSVERADDVLEIRSAGADKKFDTADDFMGARFSWPYFRPVGEKLSRAVESYQRRTGRHVRDAATLGEELRREGLALDGLRDRWGRPYEFVFGVSRTNFTVNVVSGGPDRKISRDAAPSSDDFVIWTTSPTTSTRPAAPSPPRSTRTRATRTASPRTTPNSPPSCASHASTSTRSATAGATLIVSASAPSSVTPTASASRAAADITLQRRVRRRTSARRSSPSRRPSTSSPSRAAAPTASRTHSTTSSPLSSPASRSSSRPKTSRRGPSATSRP